MIPASLLPGLRWVPDLSDQMDPFYWSVLSPYAHVNNILLAKTTQLEAPRNLWAVPMNKTINIDFVNAGLIEVGDLPLLNGSIDVAQVMDHLWQQKGTAFMVCASLQSKFCFCLGITPSHTFLSNFHEELKMVFHCQPDISFSHWELELHIPPRTTDQNNQTFQSLIKNTKSRNYKIVSINVFIIVLQHQKLLPDYETVQNLPVVFGVVMRLHLCTVCCSVLVFIRFMPGPIFL